MIYFERRQIQIQRNSNVKNNINIRKKRQKACEILKKEFDLVKQKLPQLNKLKENTLANTCQLLAQHFKVNIVIHELQKGDDYIDSIYSPKKREYDVEFARVDLLAERVGDKLTGHCEVIHPKYSDYIG